MKEVHFNHGCLEVYLRLGRRARNHSIELKKYAITGSLPTVERALRRRLRDKLRQARSSAL